MAGFCEDSQVSSYFFRRQAGFFGNIFRFKEIFSRLNTALQVINKADLPFIINVAECAVDRHNILIE